MLMKMKMKIKTKMKMIKKVITTKKNKKKRPMRIIYQNKTLKQIQMKTIKKNLKTLKYIHKNQSKMKVKHNSLNIKNSYIILLKKMKRKPKMNKKTIIMMKNIRMIPMMTIYQNKTLKRIQMKMIKKNPKTLKYTH